MRWAAGRRDLTKSVPWLESITIHPDGTAQIEYKGSSGNTSREFWTNGYLIMDQGGPQRISELFTVTIGGRDFLVIENKNGDYSRKLQIIHYFIYYQIGDQ